MPIVPSKQDRRLLLGPQFPIVLLQDTGMYHRYLPRRVRKPETSRDEPSPGPYSLGTEARGSLTDYAKTSSNKELLKIFDETSRRAASGGWACLFGRLPGRQHGRQYSNANDNSFPGERKPEFRKRRSRQQ